MIITSTSGYILSVLGPFLADSKNNDASIINHCLFENQEGILDWLTDDDIIVLDIGFRDPIKPMEMIGLQPVVPDFIKRGKTQLDSFEGNRSRCITKIRWVIESGKYFAPAQVERSGHRILQEPAGKSREMSGTCKKTPEINGAWKQYSGRKFFGHFPDDFRSVPVEKNRNSPEKSPKFFRPEYCFHVPLISGVFLREPARTLRPGCTNLKQFLAFY